MAIITLSTKLARVQCSATFRAVDCTEIKCTSHPASLKSYVS
jgi:hypothetical protein